MNEYGNFINLYKKYWPNKRITLHGVKDEESIYSKTDLIVITSRHEGFGYTMIEGATIVSQQLLTIMNLE